MKIALVTTHPIQYQIPWFQGLAKTEGIELKVFFGMIPNEQQQAIGFGGKFSWDIPLLEGYSWEALTNRARSPGLGSFWGIKSADIYQKLKRWQPDVVILTGWQSYVLIQALFAAKRLKIPLIMRGESNILRKRQWWQRIIHKALLINCQAFLPIGKSSKAFYLSYNIKKERLFTTPYFIDNNRFKEQSEALSYKQDILRNKYGIPLDAVCFLYSGKLIPKKRIMDLLEALKKLPSIAEKYHLLVIGSGELMEQAQAYVQENKLPVSFAGFLNQSEIPEAYTIADCLALPSDYGETWGLVVNEAMACGIPAIISDRVGCGADLIKEGITGSIFPFGDTEKLAQTLLTLIQNPDQLRFMGKEAQKLVFSEYAVEKAVSGTEQAIKSIIPISK